MKESDTSENNNVFKEWQKEANKIKTEPVKSLNMMLGAAGQEEFKQVAAPSLNFNSPLKLAKESIRKLPMFETYTEDTGEYDFEWPTKATLKQITNTKQL